MAFLLSFLKFMRIFVFIFALFLSNLLLAASIAVSPLLIEISDKTPMASLNLTNNEAEKSVSFQVRAFAWRQDQNGNEILSPAPQIAISPPILTIKPQSKSLVRIIRMGTDAIIGEENYRLQIEELPNSNEEVSGTGVGLLMSYSLPLFATSSKAQSLEPVWHLSLDEQNLNLQVTNNGQTKIKISSLKIVDLENKEGGELLTFSYPNTNKLPANSKVKLLAQVGLYADEYTDFGEFILELNEEQKSNN